jgi:putative oxidoreductase
MPHLAPPDSPRRSRDYGDRSHTSLVSNLERAIVSSRRAAFVALWVMVVVQAIWTVYFCVRTHPAFTSIYYPVIFTPFAAALALTRGRVRWVATSVRLLVGVAFTENVSDRLGFLGPPGAPGVSWGDFSHFIAYTAQVNAFAPAAVIPTLAVLATVAEGTFGLTMLLGVRLRLASIGSALLLLLFGSAMVLSGLSQLQYGVYLMSAASWALATVDASALSVDALLGRSPAMRVA